MTSSANLPSALRVLLDDAVSEAKRQGHDQVTPLHVASAIERVHGPVAKAEFTAEDSNAIRVALGRLPRNYGQPAVDPATRQLIAQCAASATAVEAVAHLIKERLPALVEASAASSPDQGPSGSQDEGAFERSMNYPLRSEPTADAEAAKLAEFHDVTIPPAVISAALAPARQVDTLCHPGLAVSRIDRAAASARAVRGGGAADPADLGSAVVGQQYVGFDAASAREHLGKRIFGQDHALRAVTDLLSVSRAALDANPARPDGVFVFAGPTGTGKTALALALARELFGTDEAIVRLDMSEYHDEWAISKLIGPPPGYVGSQEPESWLTTRIRNRPQSVLLLDEIEKADPRVWNTFLQVFDAGRLTDSAGRVADFRDVVVVMTTNLGAEAFSEGTLGFGTDADHDDREVDRVMATLRQAMRPELQNRLDHILVFRPLDMATVRKIAAARVGDAIDRYRERGWEVAVDDDVIDFMVAKGYSREYGARPMLRAIDQHLARRIAEVPPGSYRAQVVDDGITLTPQT